MFVEPVTAIDSAPSFGAMFGSTGRRDAVNRLNERWSRGGDTYFGSADDPYADLYETWQRDIRDIAERSTQIALDAIEEASPAGNMYRPVVSVEGLESVTLAMQAALLTHKPLRKLLDEDKIYGWGIDPSELPDEDPWERPLRNGTMVFEPGGPEADDPDRALHRDMIWYTWSSEDPPCSIDELNAISDSRMWIDEFLDETNHKIDPTHYPNPIDTIVKK